MTVSNTVEQINGITVEEAHILMNPQLTKLDKLMEASALVTRNSFGNVISMCAIYPAKVGRCSGDCAYCAQSAHHTSDVTLVNVNELDENEIVDNAKELWRLGVRRYSLVTSGECLTDTEFEGILHIFDRLHKETKIDLCGSLGSLTPDRATKLKTVGVTRYHHNIETSPSYFPNICSTHTFEDKLATIRIAQEVGLELCCGGIIGMGETPSQRVEMAFALKEIDMNCVPINILNPISGTRLEYQNPLSVDEILRTIAVFRLILPNKVLRFAGGREKALGKEEYRGYVAGINSMLVGNYLTTKGKPFEEEIHNIETAGFAVK